MKKAGYIPGRCLWGFPYDWRKDIASLLSPLKKRIIAAFDSCGKQRITIISHSMGSLLVRQLIAEDCYFMHKHVKQWIGIGSAFKGAVHILRGFLMGYNLGIPKTIIKLSTFRLLELSCPANFWLIEPDGFRYSPKLCVKESMYMLKIFITIFVYICLNIMILFIIIIIITFLYSL